MTPTDRRATRIAFRSLQSLLLAALASPTHHTPLKLAQWTRRLVVLGHAANLIPRKVTQ